MSDLLANRETLAKSLYYAEGGASLILVWDELSTDARRYWQDLARGLFRHGFVRDVASLADDRAVLETIAAPIINHCADDYLPDEDQSDIGVARRVLTALANHLAHTPDSWEWLGMER